MWNVDTFTSSEYRLRYKIQSISDCICVAEEVAAGFVSLDEGEQLDFFTHTETTNYAMQDWEV